MQKDNDIKFEDLDSILTKAQLRRSADLSLWLTEYLQSRRQARLQKATSLPSLTVTAQGAPV